jgi:hypothetical protein
MKTEKKTDESRSDAGKRLARLKEILRIVNEIDSTKWPDLNQVRSRADKVEIRAINADADSIIIDDGKFSGLFRMNMLATFNEGNEEFRSSDYVVGRFTGTFAGNKSPEITSVTLDMPTASEADPDDEE